MICDSYCNHGGCCILPKNHIEKHDSRYCQWTDDEAISKEKANEIYLLEAKLQGEEELAEAIILLEDLLMDRLKELEEENK
jgi:hypothetical protein